MRKFFLITIMFMSIFISTNAQHKRKVKSSSYNVLLKKLLKTKVPEISVDSLEKMVDDFVLLDARETDEYNVSHLAKAKLVGYNNFNIDSLNVKDKDTPIVVYCSVGYRSGKIAEKLIEKGYTNVQNLYGGIFEWKNEGNNVVDKNGITNDVHPYSKSWGIWLKKGNKVYKK